MDAINKVARKHSDKRNKKHKAEYNLIVIRISKAGEKFGISQLCEKCVIGVNNVSKKTGIKIKKIFYTDNDGGLIKTTPYKMLHLKEQHITAYYKNTNYKRKL